MLQKMKLFFFNNGYVILKKPASFWTDKGIDLNYIRKKCDELSANKLFIENNSKKIAQ